MTSKRKVHARRGRRKNRIRRQRGRGLDIQKLLAKTGREFHLSGGYQVAGPGTQLRKRLALGSQYYPGSILDWPNAPFSLPQNCIILCYLIAIKVN